MQAPYFLIPETSMQDAVRKGCENGMR